MNKKVKFIILVLIVIIIISGIIGWIIWKDIEKNSILVQKYIPSFCKSDSDCVKDDITFCKTDSDCILFSIDGCCDFVAINKNYENKLNGGFMTCEAICRVNKASCIWNKCAVR